MRHSRRDFFTTFPPIDIGIFAKNIAQYRYCSPIWYRIPRDIADSQMIRDETQLLSAVGFLGALVRLENKKLTCPTSSSRSKKQEM